MIGYANDDAGDRSIIRATGLFAFELPRPKRDARRTVFFLPSDDGGCGWLRCLLPAIGLSECTDWQADGAWGLRYTEAQIARHDVVVFQRQGSGPALRNMRRARARGQVVVYEIDDYALMAPDDPNPATAQRNATGRRFILDCIREADLVTVTTPALADAYARFNRHIAVLPNCTHPDVNRREVRPAPETPRLTVAYAAALAHRDDAALLRAVIPSVAARHPAADFLFFGDRPHGAWVCDLPRTYRMDFLPIRAYYHALQLFDVGLAPLRLNRFTLHKSALKALDYLGAGVAPVLQDHPVYAEFRHGIDCLKARTTADWIRAISLLLRTPDLRAELVANGERIVRQYDYRNHAQRWALAYEEAICRRSQTP